MNHLRKIMSDGRHLVPLNARDEEERVVPTRIVAWIVAPEHRAVRRMDLSDSWTFPTEYSETIRDNLPS